RGHGVHANPASGTRPFRDALRPRRGADALGQDVGGGARVRVVRAGACADGRKTPTGYRCRATAERPRCERPSWRSSVKRLQSFVPALAAIAGATVVLIGAETSLPKFVDIAQQAGITFQHTNGGSRDKHLVETMGSGGLFFDSDGDG